MNISWPFCHFCVCLQPSSHFNAGVGCQMERNCQHCIGNKKEPFLLQLFLVQQNFWKEIRAHHSVCRTFITINWWCDKTVFRWLGSCSQSQQSLLQPSILQGNIEIWEMCSGYVSGCIKVMPRIYIAPKKYRANQCHFASVNSHFAIRKVSFKLS